MQTRKDIPVILCVVLFGALHAQHCVTDFSGKKERSLRTTRLVKAHFYIDLYVTPHLQFINYNSPGTVAEITYGGNIGVKFPNRLAIDMGVSHYNTNRLFSDGEWKYVVNADFLEINAQIKYYFKMKKRLSWYPLVAFTTNLSNLNEALPFEDNLTNRSDVFIFHNFYISIGAGIETNVARFLSLYAEPTFRFRAAPGWSYITYSNALRLSLGLRLKI